MKKRINEEIKKMSENEKNEIKKNEYETFIEFYEGDKIEKNNEEKIKTLLLKNYINELKFDNSKYNFEIMDKIEKLCS